MSKKAGRATWFPWHLGWKDSLLSLDKEQLVELLTCAMEYFAGNEVRPVEDLGINDPVTAFAFRQIKQAIDGAFADYKASQQFGLQGAEKRRGKGG